jgi:hypothetical protein
VPDDPVYVSTIRKYYPQAISTDSSVDRILTVMCERLGLTPGNIMAADSICSDDLNSIEYPDRAREMLGPFKMGGLNGFPFTGLTGMGAFANHVPDQGAVFVFYGPHLGISRAGVLGEVVRPGQTHPSTCCGAARAALNKLLAGDIIPGDVSDLDYQQNKIEQTFLNAGTRIRSAANPLAEATSVMYEAIEARIELLAKRTHYPCRYVVLCGGILINTDPGIGSFVELRRFTVEDRQQAAVHDLMHYFDMIEA